MVFAEALAGESELGQVLVLTFAAGFMIPLGGWIARLVRFRNEHFQQDLEAGMVAVGAGALISAVALVLVPEGLHALPMGWALFWFALGTVFFIQLDRLIERSGGSASNLVATVLDFVPESLALGAAFAIGSSSGALLALLIAVQNLPEGYNSYHELRKSTTWTDKRILSGLAALVVLGPLAGATGYRFIGHDAAVLGAVALFASGAILFAIFHDLAPAAHRTCHHAPTVGASLGFAVGIAGQAHLLS